MSKTQSETPEEIRRQQNSAADLIRTKINSIYGEEPNAQEEQAEVAALGSHHLSKHQRYMQELSNSGRSMAEIQTAWHEYYSDLNNTEKHEVWQEFYSEHQKAAEAPKAQKSVEPENTHQPAPVSNNTAALQKKKRKRSKPAIIPEADLRTANDVKQELLSQIKTRSAITKNPHFRSLAFGLGMGSLTLFILLFSFFNERFISPFIRPSGQVSATPIIVDPDANGPVGPEAKIIIPKINVEAPVVYDVPTIQEADVQKGLERGVVHYITTPNPGEKGNSVIFGHSSSNILNKGKYKFAFILLKSLEKEDTFIVQKDGKRYVYKIYNKFVTAPNDFSVLNATDKTATMTLITCDPPGTSTNRLIIQAEQIFPNPASNPASTTASSIPTTDSKQLPGNSESLWHRVTNWL